MSPTQSQAVDRSASLTEAFHAFNDLSEQLAQAYARLEAQVAELAAELARARIARDSDRRQHLQLADRLGALLEILPAAVVLVDGRGRIDRFNPAAEALFQGLAWGRRWEEVCEDNRLARHGEGDWVLQGDRRVSLCSRTLEDGGRILVLLDTTEQRALEERARRQDRLADMGRMAAQLAHQIRTPLATALLYGGHLARPGLDQAQRQAFAAKLVDGLKHTERLIGDMLAFSRGGNFQPVPVSLGELAARALDAQAPRLQAEGIRVEARLACDGDDRVLGNGDALQGVIANLLENAIQHLQRGQRLALDLRLEDDRAVLRVEDEGPGIPPPLRERIFDPFFTTRERGTGLGLAVAQSVILAHGGHIEARESALGGACFQIALPRLAAPGNAYPQGETA